MEDKQFKAGQFELFKIENIAGLSIPKKIGLVIATSLVVGLFATASIYLDQFGSRRKAKTRRAAAQVEHDSADRAMGRFYMGAGIGGVLTAIAMIAARRES